ncbi:MAG: hypothetical protein KGI71_01520 [Patescibacteria group bacterium]|nr:hypothetical protein [Patescibacteria group bacterium]MDE2173182.1 hypothetical protein [Patescibacteria group bacterium]
MKSITRLISAFAAFMVLALPSQASAITTTVYIASGGPGSMCSSNGICQVANSFIYIINYVLVPLLFATAFIVFLYGIAKAYIFSGGDPEKIKDGHKIVLWGLVGFAVMVSLWGLVNVVANTFGLAGYGAPPLPTSY